MERRLFNPDDKIAPGLYMKYWQAIVAKYGADYLETNKLKSYREVRNGAILAALWTKVTGEKHFVSFPHDEPADVEIYSLSTKDFKGIPSYQLQRIPVQLTRCSLSYKETVAGQVRKKNKESLKDTTLVVHMIGEDNVTINLNEIVTEVRQIEKIYPREIVLLAPVDDAATNEQSFAQLLIYSQDDDQVRSSKVHLGETDAFFSDPSVMRSQRGTGQAIDIAGEFSLMIP
jgi:hypothetical protein